MVSKNYKNVILGVVVFYCIFIGCSHPAREQKSSYKIISNEVLESIEYFLINDSEDIIDSIKVRNNIGLIEDLPTKLIINRNNEGWSCFYQQEINDFNNQYDSLYTFNKVQEQFLLKIIEIEDLKQEDKEQIVKYWKDLSDKNIIFSIDPEWLNIQKTYFEILVFNFDSSRGKVLNFDTCEIRSYIALMSDFENPPNTNFYSSLNLIIEDDTNVNSNVFFNPMYRKLSISSDALGNLKLKISRAMMHYR